jgi:hypothetical protein
VAHHAGDAKHILNHQSCVCGALREHHGSHSHALDSNGAEILVHHVFSPGQFRQNTKFQVVFLEDLFAKA